MHDEPSATVSWYPIICLFACLRIDAHEDRCFFFLDSWGDARARAAAAAPTKTREKYSSSRRRRRRHERKITGTRVYQLMYNIVCRLAGTGRGMGGLFYRVCSITALRPVCPVSGCRGRPETALCMYNVPLYCVCWRVCLFVCSLMCFVVFKVRCLVEIENDMIWRKVPMDRLLCGDVGFGKTEVAIRAMFRWANQS